MNSKMLKLNAKGTKGTKDENETSPASILTIRGAKRVLMFAILAVALFIPFLGKAVGVKLSALYLLGNDGKISGRTSGDVYMSNGRKRRFAIPALVRNAYTSGVRIAMGSFSSAWNTVLSDSNRLAWGRFEMTVMNRFKQNVTIKGKPAYVACSMNNFAVGGGLLNDPLLGASAPAGTPLDEPLIELGTSKANIIFTTNPEGTTTLVSATIGFAPGVSRPSQSAFRNVTVIDTTGVLPINIWTAYVAKFGTPILGSRVFIQVKVIDIASGLPSAITQTNTIVQA